MPLLLLALWWLLHAAVGNHLWDRLVQYLLHLSFFVWKKWLHLNPSTTNCAGQQHARSSANVSLCSMCQLPPRNACLLSQGASSPSIHAHFQNKPRQVWAHCSMPLDLTYTSLHYDHWAFMFEARFALALLKTQTSGIFWIRNLDCALVWNWSKPLLRLKETPSNIRHGVANGVAKVRLNMTWRDLFDLQLEEENWNLKGHAKLDWNHSLGISTCVICKAEPAVSVWKHPIQGHPGARHLRSTRI